MVVVLISTIKKREKNRMKKKNNEKDLNASVSLERSAREFEIFKSRVANAVLDYMEAQSDRDLIECLESSSTFLSNISVQMENVFDSQKQALQDQNGLFEIGDDLFSTCQQNASTTVH